MPVHVIGIGNWYRGDDAAGLVVADAIQKLGLPGVEVSLHDGEGARLIEVWRETEKVILIDSARTGAVALGGIVLIDALREPLPYPDLASPSSHSFGPHQAVELARILGRLPETLLILAIEASDFTIGAPLSAPVRAAVGPSVRRVLACLAELGESG